MSIQHLTDDELDTVLCGEPLPAGQEAHLHDCLVCRRRRDAFLAAVEANREADPDDERVSRVYLCDKGRAMIEEIRSAFAALNGVMFDGIPEADLERLRHQLTRMQANLQSYQP